MNLKRFISLVLAMTMIFSLAFPGGAFAYDGEDDIGIVEEEESVLPGGGTDEGIVEDTENDYEETHTHNLTYYPETAAGCTETGNHECWYCEDCGAFFLDEECTNETTFDALVIPAAGHEYVEGVCAVCGEADPDYVAEELPETVEETLEEETILLGAQLSDTAKFERGGEYVAWIGEQGYATLQAAIEAADNDATITLGAGEFTTYGTTYAQRKTLSFVGTVDAEKNLLTTWRYGQSAAERSDEYGGDYSLEGSNVSFENIIFQDNCTSGNNVNYRGFIRPASVSYKNCVFNSRNCYWTANTATFENCIFAETGGYNLWINDGKTYSFKNCTFYSRNSRFVNCYNNTEGLVFDVSFDDCRFTYEGQLGQKVIDNDANPAIYLKSNSDNRRVTWHVIINNTVSDLTAYAPLYADKNFTSNPTDTTITVNGKLVWANGQPVATATVVVDNNGTVTAAIDNGYFKANETGNVTIAPAAEDNSSVSITFNAEAANAISAAAGDSSLSLKVEDTTAVNTADTENGEKVYTISIVKTDAQGNETSVSVFDKDAVATYTGAKATVTVPYTVTNGNMPLVYFLSGDTRTPVTVTGYTATTVTFEVKHFSDYLLTQTAPVASVTVGDTTTGYVSLHDAISYAATCGKNATVELLTDIDLANATWDKIELNGYVGAAKEVTIQGKNHYITGLTSPLIFATWSSTSIKIYDLTIKDSVIGAVYSSHCGGNVSSPFIGSISASYGIVLKNCHAINCTLNGGKYSGGLYGYANGYSNQNDGPAFSDVTIIGCSVENCTINGSGGSAGALVGHATGDAWTSISITNTTATGNKITGENEAKTGLLIGTLGAGTTADGKTGGVWLDANESNNTVFTPTGQLTEEKIHVFGRIAGGTGTITDGTYSVDPTKTSDPADGTLAPAEDYQIVQNAENGTYGVKPMPAVAYIGATGYTTLAKALAAVKENESITILAGPHDLPAATVIPAGVTIKGAGNSGESATTLTITTTNGDGLKITNQGIHFEDLAIDGTKITSGGYKSLINVVADGCVIDNVVMTGGGKSTWNSSILVERLTADQTFTVKNSNITGSFRGVLRESCNANIVIDNCDIDAVYPFNIDGGNGGTVTVTDSALHGWTSYGGVNKVTFTNVEFSKGDSGYNAVAAYVDTKFEECKFNTGNDSAFNVYAQATDFNFTFNECKKDGVEITDENLPTMFSDSNVWSKCETAIDVETNEAGAYSSGTVVSSEAPTCATGSHSLKIGVSSDKKSNVFKVGSEIEISDPVSVGNGKYTVTLQLLKSDNTVLYEKTNQEITVVGTSDVTIEGLDGMASVVKKALEAADAMATDVTQVELSVTIDESSGENSYIYTVDLKATPKNADGNSLSNPIDDIKNTDFSGASFRFFLPVTGLANNTAVKIIHSSTDYADETYYATVTDGEVPVTVTHFSTFTVSTLEGTGPVYNSTNGKRYESISAALADTNFTSGDTLVLLDNINANRDVVSKTVTIDLNGKTITGTQYALQAGEFETLTIIDSVGTGTISGTTYGITTGMNANVNLNGGTISAPTAVSLGSDSNAVVDGATLNGTNYGIKTDSTGAITVKSGSVNATAGEAISTNGAVTVSGGTVSGNTFGVHSNSTGKVTVSGGEVSANLTSGNAIAAMGAVEITGGSVSGYKAVNNLDQIQTIITGGTITGILDSNVTTNNTRIAASGGTFDRDPGVYVADGMISWKGTDGTYTIKDAVTVTLNANGGTLAGETAFKAAKGETFQASIDNKLYSITNPTRSAHSFEGWTSDSSAAAADADAFTTALTGNVEFYAVWKEAVASYVDDQGATHYFGSLAEAINAVETNALRTTTVTLHKNDTIAAGTLNNIEGKTNLVIDLGGHEVKWLANDVHFDKGSDVIIQNGTIDISGAYSNADCIIGIGWYNTSANTLTLDHITLKGDGYSSAYGVLYAYDQDGSVNTLNVNNCTVDLKNDAASAGGVFKMGSTVDILNITDSTIKLENNPRGITTGTVTIKDSSFTMTGGDNGIHSSNLTVEDSRITITNGSGRGITAGSAPIVIKGNSTVTLSGNGEGDLRLDNGSSVSVLGTSTLAPATIKENGNTAAAAITSDSTATAPHVLVADTEDAIIFDSYTDLAAAFAAIDTDGKFVTLIGNDASAPTVENDATLVTGNYAVTGLVSVASGILSIKGNGVFKNYPSKTAGTLAISGGFYPNKVLEDDCAAGYIPVNTKTEDKGYTVVSGEIVARIGDVGYGTLQEAFDAVNASTAESVTLTIVVPELGGDKAVLTGTQDPNYKNRIYYHVTKPVIITKPANLDTAVVTASGAVGSSFLGFDGGLTLAEGVTFNAANNFTSLDLMGNTQTVHTINGLLYSSNQIRVFKSTANVSATGKLVATPGASLAVREGGTLNVTGNDTYNTSNPQISGYFRFADGGNNTLTLTNTYARFLSLSVEDEGTTGTLTLTNSTVESDRNWAFDLAGKGTVSMTKSQINMSNTGSSFVVNAEDSFTMDAASSITTGTWTNNGTVNVIGLTAETALPHTVVTVTGEGSIVPGTFTTEEVTGKSFLTTVKENNIVVAQAVARVGSGESAKYFETLAEAVAASNSGDTITLVADAELTDRIWLKSGVTLDGAGHTIKPKTDAPAFFDNRLINDSGYAAGNGLTLINLAEGVKDVTIMNVTLDSNSGYPRALIGTGNNTTITLENVTLNHTSTTIRGADALALNGDAKIKGNITVKLGDRSWSAISFNTTNETLKFADGSKFKLTGDTRTGTQPLVFTWNSAGSVVLGATEAGLVSVNGDNSKTGFESVSNSTKLGSKDNPSTYNFKANNKYYTTFALAAAEAGNTGTVEVFADPASTDSYTLTAPDGMLKVVKNGKNVAKDVTVKAPEQYELLESTVTETGVTTTTYTLAEAVASITRGEGDEAATSYYATLQGAVDAAQNGDTVKLLVDLKDDTALTSRVEVNASGKSITIDLNAKTVNPTASCGNGSAFDVKSGTVTIKNGTIDGTAIKQTVGSGAANECDPITARSGAHVTLENLTITIDSITGACVYAFDGGEITITSGTYTNQTTVDYPYKAGFKGLTVNQANGQGQLIHITGGTFIGNDPQLGDDSNGARAVDSGNVAMPANGTTAGQNGTYNVVPGSVVTFDVDGGTPAIPEQRIAKDGKATKPADPTKANFVFDNWYQVNGDTMSDSAYNFDSPITEDITLKATWTGAVASVTHTEGEGENAVTTVTYFTTLPAAVGSAVTGDTVTLLADINLGNNTLTINKGITLDGTYNGGSHSISSTNSVSAIKYTTSDKVIIQNLQINATRGIEIYPTSAHLLDLELNNVDMSVTQRGISMNEGGVTNSSLVLNNCDIVFSGFDANTQPYINNQTYRGISLWEIVNTNVEITGGSIKGFAYDINIAGNVISSANTVSVNDTELHGRAAINNFGSNNTFTLTKCGIYGYNEQNGPTESFACIVDNVGDGNNTYIVDECDVHAFIAEGLDGNAAQHLAALRGTNAKLLLKGDTTYTINDPARGGLEERIEKAWALDPGTEIHLDEDAYNNLKDYINENIYTKKYSNLTDDGYLWMLGQQPIVAFITKVINNKNVTENYYSLADAVKAADPGDTIYLNYSYPGDIILTETQVIDKDLTINLNSKSITATNARALWVKSGDVTITGTGTVSSTHTEGNTSFANTSSVIRVGDAAANTNTAGLTIDENVTVSTDYCYGVTVFGKNNDDNAETNDISLYVSGTVAVTGSQAAISGNGSSDLSATDIYIDADATVTSQNTYAIYHPGKGDLFVEGTVEGLGGIEAKGGNVAILGGTVKATGTPSYPGVNNDGTSTSGYAIAAIGNGGYTGGPAEVVIEDGTITGKVMILSENNSGDPGSITSYVNTIATEDGFAWKKIANNDYQLVEAVAKIEKEGVPTKFYASLADAVTAAAAGDTIEVIADDRISLTSLNAEILINKDLTITGETNSDDTPKYTIYGCPTDNGDSNDVFIKNPNTAINVKIENLRFSEFGNEESSGGSMDSGVIFVSASGHLDTNVTFKNLVFDKFNRIGVAVSNCTFDFDGCSFDGAKEGANKLTKAIEFGGNTSGTIQNCMFINCGSNMSPYSAAAIEAYDSSEIIVEKTIIKDCQDGIVIQPTSINTPSNITVEDVTIENTTTAMYSTRNSVLTVKSGTFDGKVSALIYGNDDEANCGILDIRGGTFNGNVTAKTQNDLKITGGFFKGEVVNGETDPTTVDYVVGGHYKYDPSAVVDLTKHVVIKETIDNVEWYTLSNEVVALNTTTNVGYLSLADAVAAAVDGDTVVLLKNASGNGIIVPQGKFGTTGLTVNLGNYTYTLDGTAVGSTGTETSGFQLLKDNKITFTNGAINVAETNADNGNFKRVFQSYADVTFNNVTVDGTNLNGSNAANEFCNGNVSITGNSSFTAKENVAAINVDAWNGAYPDGAHLTVNTTGTISGIHCYTEGTGTAAASNLHITAGTVNNLSVADGSTVVVTKDNNAAVTAPAGYAWTRNTDSTMILGPVVAKIGTVGYAKLQDAVNAAQDGETVTLLVDLKDNTALTSRVEVNPGGGKSITIDLGGKIIAVTHTSGNGSAFNIQSGSVTIKNGTIDGTGVVEGQTGGVTVADGICLVTVRSGAILYLTQAENEDLYMVVNSKNGCCVYPFAGGEVHISGGTYENKTTEAYQYKDGFKGLTVNQANGQEQLIHITGGTFIGNDPQLGDDSNGAREVETGYVAMPGTTDGTFNVVEGGVVTFDTDGGTPVPEAQRVKKNARATKPENPTKDGVAFAGWFAEGATSAYSFSNKVTADVKLTAQWVEPVVKVSADGEEDALYATLQDAFTGAKNKTNAVVTMLQDVTLTKDVNVWYDCTLDLNGKVISRATSSVAVTALTIAGPTLTVVDSVGGGKITAANNPADKGANAIKLYVGSDLIIESGTFEVTGGHADAVVYVEVATAASPCTVTINGGTFTSDGDASYMLNVQDSYRDNATITVTGGTFKGFDPQDNIAEGEHTDITADGYVAIPGTTDGTFEVVEGYVVTFDVNGGTPDEIAEQRVKKDAVPTKPTAPTKEGVNFKGWFVENATAPYKFTEALNADTELKAMWDVTVTFRAMGGTFDGQPADTKKLEIKIDENGKVSESDWPIVKREHFVLDSWTDLDHEVYDKNSIFTENITLIAIWNLDEYTVRFDSADGSEVAEQSVVYNKYAVKPGDPTRTGYTFAGWYNGEAQNAFDFANTEITSNITLTAHWTPVEYAISYNLDGGTLAEGATNPATYTIVSEAITLNNPTKEGYTFAGWTGTDLTTATDMVTIAQGKTGERSYTATWTAKEFTITWLNDNGSQIDTTTVAYGENPTHGDATKAADAQYTYTFAGWDPAIVPVSGDATYKATFNNTLNKYTVTFVDEDGTTVLKEATEYDYGTAADSIAKPETDPTKEATVEKTFTFAGWTPEIAAVTADATYTATYTDVPRQYTVTFDADNGTETVEAKVNYNSVATKPVDPEKANYSFAGWFNGNDAFDFNTAITADITLTAKWTINTFTVTFDSDGGSTVESQSVEYNAKAVYPDNNPTKPGHSFSGWFEVTGQDVDGKDILADEAFKFSRTSITADITLKAKWTAEKYTVTFVDADGKLLQSSNVDYGTTPTAPADPTKAADAQYTYTFSGWDPALATVTDAATYTATYSTTVNKYTIKFVNENGQELQSSKVAYGEMPATPTDVPTKDADAQYTYTFSGWTPEIRTVTGDATYTATYDKTLNQYTITFVNEDGTVLQSGKVYYDETPVYTGTPTKASTAQYTYTFKDWTPEISAVTGDKTYTATYTETVNKYAITFENDDGTELQSSEVEYGAMPTAPSAEPTKEATAQYTYTFSGWTPEIGTVTGNATYTATYTDVVNKYTIKFVNEDGTELQSSEVEYGATPTYSGEKPTKAPTAEKTYTFSNWSPAITAVTGTATYTATYTDVVNKYKVTFDSKDGSTVASLDVDYNTTVTKPTDPTKTGYTFDGWFKDAECQYAWNFAQDKITEDTTLYAKWTANQYTITFDTDGGSEIAAITQDYNTEVIAPANPTKKGYTFAGWDNQIPTTMPAENVTVKATWTAINYTIDYELGGGTLAEGATNPETYTVETNDITLKNPTREGYNFAGWTGTGLTEATETVTIAKGSTDNRSYTATWTAKTYTITFKANYEGGAADVTQTVTATATNLTANAFVRANHSFEGWNTEADGEGTKYTDKQAVTLREDTTLYAQWKYVDTMEIGKGLELNDSIVINLYIGSYSASEESYQIKTTFVDEKQEPITTVEGKLSDLLASGEASMNNSGIITIHIANTISYQMTDKVHVTITYLPENVKLYDFDYSVQEYCETMIEKYPGNTKLVNVCTATLDYGAYSQKHFKYKVDDLANAHYTAGNDIVENAVIPENYNISATSGSCTGLSDPAKQTGKTVNLLSATEIRFMFKPDDPATYGDYSFTVNGKPANAEVYNGVLLLKVNGVAAPNLDDGYVVTIVNTTDDSKLSLTYSVMSYAYSAQAKPDSIGNMAKALYLYFKAASEYFV